MASQTTVDKTTKNVIEAVKEWLSRSGDKEIGLMDLAVLEELIAQVLDTEEQTRDL
ncbi:MAG: hypothetical protein PVI06_06615 [Desulfobacterales bacterium]|jgi:hypothetical protein